MKKDTITLFHISRNFVEFGAFTALEIASFRQRGVLGDRDYVRSAEGHDWLPVRLWTGDAASGLLESKPAAKPKATASRKRSATTAKASKKGS